MSFQIDEPTLWDRALSRQLMSNISLFKGSTFVLTILSKVGRASRVFTFLVDPDHDPGNFCPVILKVSNLADVEPVAYHEVNIKMEMRLFLNYSGDHNTGPVWLSNGWIAKWSSRSIGLGFSCPKLLPFPSYLTGL